MVSVGAESSAITLTVGEICPDAPENLDAVTIGLIAAAASAASLGGVKLVIKLKKFIKGILGLPGGKPMNPKKKKKVIKIMKAGMKAMFIIKKLKVEAFLKIKAIIKKVKLLPLKLGLIKILAGPGGIKLKFAKLKEFLKDIKGLDKDNFNIIKKILGLLTKGDNDSLLEKVIGGIKGALKLSIG